MRWHFYIEPVAWYLMWTPCRRKLSTAKYNHIYLTRMFYKIFSPGNAECLPNMRCTFWPRKMKQPTHEPAPTKVEQWAWFLRPHECVVAWSMLKEINRDWGMDTYPHPLYCVGFTCNYRQVSNIRRTLVGNKIVDHSDVVGASPVGAAPTTSSFST